VADVKKIAIILGTRAEFIKLFTVMRELDSCGIEYEFIHTGQHSLGDFPKKFKTRAPDVVIDQRNGFNTDTSGAAKWAVQTLPKIINYLKSQKDIEYVLVHGDTLSCLISCIAAKLAGKKVIHVEAGLRSGNLLRPMPEEIVRNIVDFFSSIKFAVSKKSAARLSGEVYNVGNTCYDALDYAFTLPNDLKLHLPDKYAVCTFHRHETLKNKSQMEKIVNILSCSQIPVYIFMHKNTEQKLKEYGLWPLKGNIIVKDPLPYEQILRVMKNAKFVISDSGGLQEECAGLNVPFICLRSETEREELLERSDQILTKFDEETTKVAIMKFSLPRALYKSDNPYYNGGASAQIVGILSKKGI